MGLFGLFNRKSQQERIEIQDIPLALLNTFVEYQQRLYNELSQTKIANDSLQDEIAVFLYSIVDISAKVSHVNHTKASHLIYEHSIKSVGSMCGNSFGVFYRTKLYLEIFLEPQKAKGLWMANNQKLTNPFAACMVAFGDVLTNPQCVDDMESYYTTFAVNLYDFFDTMDFQAKFLSAFETYQQYITRVTNLIEKMDKLG